MKTSKFFIAMFAAACFTACSTTLSQDAPKPSFQYMAAVNHVIDGDTVSFEIDLGFHVWIHDQSIRLVGVYAPEIKSGTKAEKDAGQLVKSFVTESINSAKEIIVQTQKDKTDKYGRYLGTVWLDGKNLNDAINEFMKAKGVAPSGKGVK